MSPGAEAPDRLRRERELWGAGARAVAGVDEAGRGALFGPVVAAAVVLDPRADLSGYCDSKALTATRRETLFERLRDAGHAWAAASVSASEIDGENILRATLRAMSEAVGALPVTPDWVLVDGDRVPAVNCQVEAVVRGDATSASVGAASIVAKVLRDRAVRALEGLYPGYGVGQNKGYGTREHLEALGRLGRSPLHRRSFRVGVAQGSLWR